MSTENRRESFGLPGQAVQVFEILRAMAATVVRPTTPFVPPGHMDFALGTDSEKTVLQVLEEVQAAVIPHCIQLRHPWAMAHMVPPPSTVSVIADLLIGLMNQCAFIWEEAPLATILEKEVLRWLAARLGLPPDVAGVLTGGGTASNCLAAFGAAERARALDKGGSRRWCVVASDQAHTSLEKATALTGMPHDAMVRVPTDSRGRVVPGRVGEVSRRLIREGRRPILFVCTAGTPNAGAIEPLDEFLLAAGECAAWCHVDAAYGGMMCLSRVSNPASVSWRLADSISWDPHKSLYVSYSAGAIFLRDPTALDRLRANGDYALRANGSDSAEMGRLDGSRRMEALKLWMTIKHFGRKGFADMIDRTCATSRAFAEHVRSCRDLQLLSEPDTNVVCFRYVGEGLSAEQEDAINISLQRALFFAGGPLLSTTRIDGRVFLRAVLLNPELQAHDIVAVVRRVRLEANRQVAGGLLPLAEPVSA